MLGLGLGELLVLSALAMIVVKPQHLPHIMRGLGRGLASIKRIQNQVRSTLDQVARVVPDKHDFSTMAGVRSDRHISGHRNGDQYERDGHDGARSGPHLSVPGEASNAQQAFSSSGKIETRPSVHHQTPDGEETPTCRDKPL